MKALTLLSGGMDSATVLGHVLTTFPRKEVLAVSFRYGSKHQTPEIEAARRIVEYYSVPWKIIDLPEIFTNSSLLREGKSLPTGRTLEGMGKDGVAPSYVPARNTVFLSLVAAIAEASGATSVWYGAHREDHVGYPDCRPEFVEALSKAIELGTVNRIRVYAPFVHVEKADIVRKASELGVPLELTYSCYQGLQPSCGVCDTCVIRKNAFRTAGIQDPIPYRFPEDVPSV